MLPALKEKGFTVLALEIHDKYQSLFDQYTDGKITIDELEKFLPQFMFIPFRSQAGKI